jgi:hypothetical protein
VVYVRLGSTTARWFLQQPGIMPECSSVFGGQPGVPIARSHPASTGKRPALLIVDAVLPSHRDFGLWARSGFGSCAGSASGLRRRGNQNKRGGQLCPRRGDCRAAVRMRFPSPNRRNRAAERRIRIILPRGCCSMPLHGRCTRSGIYQSAVGLPSTCEDGTR